MSSLAQALRVHRLVQDDVALRMLRMDSLPLVAGVLATHLGAPNASLPTHELHDALDAELDTLRDHLDLSGRTAKAYCEDWRQAGLLERRIADEAREEVYELTPAARQGLRVVEQLLAPRASVTESRLVSLLTALHQLALETDPDTSTVYESPSIALNENSQWSSLSASDRNFRSFRRSVAYRRRTAASARLRAERRSSRGGFSLRSCFNNQATLGTIFVTPRATERVTGLSAPMPPAPLRYCSSMPVYHCWSSRRCSVSSSRAPSDQPSPGVQIRISSSGV